MLDLAVFIDPLNSISMDIFRIVLSLKLNKNKSINQFWCDFIKNLKLTQSNRLTV